MLWYSGVLHPFLPGWVVHVATIIHSDEALLAVDHFTIHFYNTHLPPGEIPHRHRWSSPAGCRSRSSKSYRPREYQAMVESGKLDI